MDSFVFTAVLFAAACHAGWNAAIKTGLDPLTSTVLITTGAGTGIARADAVRRVCRPPPPGPG